MEHIDVQVISKGFVKPSTSTQHHLRHYQLSYLDQIALSTYIPMVLFYHCNLPRLQLRNLIKNSLSETLTHYYPLAGRVKSRLCIDCNDQGAFYIEAHATCKLSEVLEKLNSNDAVNKFLPPIFENHDGGGNALALIVQLTFFDCGGMSIGVQINHEVSDASSFITFLNTWSAIARGETHFNPPLFDAAKLFPPKLLSRLPPNSETMLKDKLVAERFEFNNARIAHLMNRYSDKTAGGGCRPTRFEALSAFIWNRFMVATQPKETTGGRIYTLRTPVNVRRRMKPPLPENYFGNISVVVESSVPVSLETNLHGNHDIVRSLRDSVKQINHEYVKKLQQIDEQSTNTLQPIDNNSNNNNREIIPFVFTSLHRFPLHEVNFGWGNPVYGGLAPFASENMVAFVETKTRDGIEAFVCLKEEDMAKFLVDEHIVATKGSQLEFQSKLARL